MIMMCNNLIIIINNVLNLTNIGNKRDNCRMCLNCQHLYWMVFDVMCVRILPLFWLIHISIGWTEVHWHWHSAVDHHHNHPAHSSHCIVLCLVEWVARGSPLSATSAHFSQVFNRFNGQSIACLSVYWFASLHSINSWCNAVIVAIEGKPCYEWSQFALSSYLIVLFYS